MAVAALDAHDARDAELPRRLHAGQARRVAVLRVDEVVRAGVQDLRDEVVEVALEVPAALLPERLAPDDAHARDRRGRPAAVHAGARLVAAVLRDHRHLVAERDELPEEVRGVDAHPAHRGEVAPGDEADPHAVVAARSASRSAAMLAGTSSCARCDSRESSTQTRPPKPTSVIAPRTDGRSRSPSPNGKVDVLPALHVLHGDRRRAGRELADRGGRVALLRDEAVADVEREPLGLREDGERVVEVGDRHAGLGLERDPHALRRGVRVQPLEALEQVRARLLELEHVRDPREARDALRLEHVRDVDRVLEEVEAPLALLRRGRDERRLVLVARVEQEARARLDDAAQAEVVQPLPDEERPLEEVRRDGVEVLDVERERDAVVAVLREQLERVLEPVVLHPVRVVGVAQHAAPQRWASASAATWRAGSR